MHKEALFSRPQKGLTLFEVLITLSVIALLAGIAVPNIGPSLARSERLALEGVINGALRHARHLAIEKQREVTLCGINDESECSLFGFDQLVIFNDVNRNRVYEESEDLYRWVNLRYNGDLRWRAALRAKHTSFQLDGSATRAGSFVYCREDAEHAAARVTLSMTGRSYIARDRDRDGVVEMTDGSPIRCDG